MENIKMTVKGTKLTLEIDLAQELRPSATGKTTLVATSAGSQAIPGFPDVMLGVNCFKYPPKKPAGRATDHAAGAPERSSRRGGGPRGQ